MSTIDKWIISIIFRVNGAIVNAIDLLLLFIALHFGRSKIVTLSQQVTDKERSIWHCGSWCAAFLLQLFVNKDEMNCLKVPLFGHKFTAMKMP